jgi:thiosulfate/3-mercaptopyruvate sulfurtransferase
MADNPKGYVNPHLLETPAGLAARLAGDEPPLVIDLRPADAFAAGHIPGAVHLDLFGVSLIDTDPAPLRAFLWVLEHLLASRGVSASRPVVVYDERSGMRAARAFWALEYFGHERTQLLDGGFGAWEAGGHPVSTTPAPPTPATWTGARVDERLATWRDVADRLGSDDAVVLDTRTPGEYHGTTVRAARGGCVPGAVHIEWTDNLAADGTFKPATELRAMYEAAGVTPDKEVLTYCQGGYRAAHSYLALRLLGYPRVRTYVGSWKEWGDRLDLPVEIPAAPPGPASD